MATDLERLVVSLEARTNAFEKAMKRATGVADQQARKIEQRFAGINFGKDVFLPFARGALIALAPILSVAAAVRGAKEALQEFGDIADQSKAAGIDSEFFQSLAHQAQLAGIEIGTTAGALATFAKNSGLAVEGKGRMVTALKALNPVLLENIRNAKTQEERIKLIADALDSTVDPARRAAIATAAFGEAGLKLAAAFEGGGNRIEEMMVKAKQLGLIVDRELIARADELGDEFDTTSKIVDLKLKQAFVNLGPVLIWLTGLAADFAGQIGATIDGLNALQNQATSTLEGRLAGIQTQLNANIDGGPQIAPIDPTAASTEQAAIMAELRRRALDNLRTQLGSKPPSTGDLPTLEEMEQGVKTQKEAASAAIQHASAIKDLLADLQFEQDQLGRSAKEQEVWNNLHRVGADAASEEGKAIRAATEALYDKKLAADAAKDAMEELGQAGVDALTGLADIAADGKFELSEMLNLATQLAKEVLPALLGKGGGGGSFLASLIGGIGGSIAGNPLGNVPSSFVPGGFYPGLAGKAGGMASGGNAGMSSIEFINQGTPQKVVATKSSDGGRKMTYVLADQVAAVAEMQGTSLNKTLSRRGAPQNLPQF